MWRNLPGCDSDRRERLCVGSALAGATSATSVTSQVFKGGAASLMHYSGCDKLASAGRPCL